MPVFGQASLKSRSQLHPKLQAIVDEAIKEIDFKILDAVRGKAAQELAFKLGRTKAHFGQSAHNYVPAIAMDLFPAPYDWDNTQSFINLSKVILRIAKAQGTPVRWGGDWDMDGKINTTGLVDLPHYELNPWRDWAKGSHLYND
jgi:peptidoglycan L-alanyl-D-glutamate endopeptidase CwlK